VDNAYATLDPGGVRIITANKSESRFSIGRPRSSAGTISSAPRSLTPRPPPLPPILVILDTLPSNSS
jgi:hypothetical protein